MCENRGKIGTFKLKHRGTDKWELINVSPLNRLKSSTLSQLVPKDCTFFTQKKVKVPW